MKFSSSFFMGNRQRLCQSLPGHLIVIPAHALVQYSADLHYPFRQDSNFWYLTGINDPDVVLVLDTDSGESTLLYPEQNDYQKEWDGKLDEKTIKTISGITLIARNLQLARMVKSALGSGKKVGYLAPPAEERIEPYGFYANPARKLLAEKLRKLAGKDNLIDIRLDIARLRQVKQPIEIEAIKAAIGVTAKTLHDVKNKLGSYKSEKDIERAVTAGFYTHGGDGHAFEPIVASGKNAAVIHYVTNNAIVHNNHMLLLDIGSQVDGYAADISRTWSLGEMSDRQKEIYAACLDIQKVGIDMLKPGAFLKDIQEDLSVYAQKVFKRLNCSMEDKPFPHGFSHYLGLDVHDAGDYTVPLTAGMVVTMEPGIYLPDEEIGVRIEDDILITENGAENLSEMIPKLL